MTHIGFLGLGAMGSRMASRLLQAGHMVTIWNRNAAAAEPLQQLGARVARTPAQATEGADLVFSMVTDDDAARAVWLDGPAAAATVLKTGAIAIEVSTVTPQWISTLGKAVAARGAFLLDAPVAGSRPQAEAGALIFMVGGEPTALGQAQPVLEQLAAKVLHVGPLGQGATLKLALNALFAAQLASLAELLGFLSRSGFTTTQVAQWLGEFPIVAPPLAGAASMMAANNHAPLFTIDLIEKDLRYLSDIAQTCGADLPTVRQTLSSLRTAQTLGWGTKNVTGIAGLFA
jgi:3-hydroxyisobutyrate dehydrogenase